MIKELRQKYNSAFKKELYDEMVHSLNEEYGYKINFRIAETPVFLPADFKNELLKAGDEIISILNSPEYIKFSRNAIPEKLNVLNEDEHPHMLALDFAVCRNTEGKLFPQLIELQAFPSLYYYQQLLNNKFRKYFTLGSELKNLFSGLDEESYYQKLSHIILNNEEPENVILLEIYPEKQKTRIDFSCTENILNIRSVHIEDVIKEKDKLYYNINGKRIRIKRIYNRVIFDELLKYDLDLRFKFREELDVEWVPHPNWFFRISKYSLPYLRSIYVPETVFLSDLNTYPNDIENFILKPLYSFAGTGVVYDVNFETLDMIKDKNNYIIQKKIQYEPVIETPDVPAKVEIRLLYVYDNKFQLVNNLVRLSKGKMMGVDYNKENSWVGSSIAYYLD